ncbi:cytochrome c [Trinickia caryophylli]|nr:cytochrome c [Trinickia caryophylli]
MFAVRLGPPRYGVRALYSHKTKPGVRMNRLCKALVVLEVAVAGWLGWAIEANAAEAVKPDATKGQAIATGVCAACHGADGNSASSAFPKLAGQHQAYLVKQLNDFKVKPGEKVAARQNPIMAGIVGPLSDQDMANVAAYFAQQVPKGGAAHDAATVALGQKIYRGGIADKGVPACASCHGPTGQGLPVQYPRVSGQWADYTSAQLTAFAGGTRKNEVMQPIASRLSEKELKAVADYMAGLH